MLSDKTDKKQGKHLFKAGQSGNPNGRPKGQRNKLGEEFIQTLADDFRTHGQQVVEKVRVEHPEVYLKTIAQIVPKAIEVKADVDHKHEHRHIAVSTINNWLGQFASGSKDSDAKTPMPH